LERGVKADPGYLTGDSQSARELVIHAKNNRKGATEAEALLWINLRNRRLVDKFRRQHPVGNYLPDFVCLEKRLIIEVDGGYHNTAEQVEIDENRAFELEQKYLFKVIRFTNEEVLNNIEFVLDTIRMILSERT
jgi:leucyl-tRNA synthetase